MRSYTVSAVALAIESDSKWVENLLSAHPIAGVEGGGRQGAQRRITHAAALTIAVARRLNVVGLPIPLAIEWARTAIGAGGKLPIDAGILLSIDLDGVRTELDARLANAVEFVVTPRRGRPPRR